MIELRIESASASQHSSDLVVLFYQEVHII
jgi:hypothetical protein